MYKEFFGLTDHPYSLSPDPRFFYLTPQHKEALAKMDYAIKNKSGMAVVFGDVGTGKTTIARLLWQRLLNENERGGARYNVAMIVNPKLKSDNALLRAILREYEVPTQRSFEGSLANFRDYLTSEFENDRYVVLIIDEAQNLQGGRRDMFELLRQLSNYETNTEKLIQMLLFGQNELATKLDKRRALKSRVAQFGALTSLTENDAFKMVEFRWKVAGGTNLPFSKEAIKTALRYSQGLPRELNKILDTSLLKAFANEQREIGPEIVESAAEEVRLKEITDD